MVVTKAANKLAAPSRPIASQFQSGRHERGVGDPNRWMKWHTRNANMEV